jgi:DNA-binding NarL/FixJ family response regulator
MNSRQTPEPTVPTAVLCGSDPGVTLLEQQALGHAKISVRRVTDAELVLKNRLAEDCCGIVITLDLAIRHLRPSDSGATLSNNVPLLVLLPSEGIDNEMGEQLLRCGASGFLENQCGIDVVELALRRASEGQLWVSRSLLSWVFKQSLVDMGLHRLTAREHEILQGVADGATNQEIAENLFVTRETVRWHLRAVYNKLGVHSRDAVVALMKAYKKATRS